MPLTASPLVCLTLVALTTAPVEAPKPVQGVRLQYMFREGETISYHIEHDLTLVASKPPVQDRQDTRSVTDQQYQVIDVAPDGTATLRLAIAAARMEYRFDDAEPKVFDSREPGAPDPAFQHVKAAIGPELAELKLRPNGTIESLRPLLRPDKLNAIPGKLGLEGDAASHLFVVFPNRHLKVGESWSDTSSTRVTISGKLTQEVKILRQYRLESVDGDIATIHVKTAPLTILADPTLLVQLIQRTTAGTIRFNVKTGRAIDRNVEFDNIEIGWAGDDSSYRAISTWSEKLVAEPAVVSVNE
jgi:hypothetical protein